MFYRREGFKTWKGPAVVIGVDHKNVIVRHGSAIYRCHPCHLMKVTQMQDTSQSELTSELPAKTKTNISITPTPTVAPVTSTQADTRKVSFEPVEHSDSEDDAGQEATSQDNAGALVPDHTQAIPIVSISEESLENDIADQIAASISSHDENTFQDDTENHDANGREAEVEPQDEEETQGEMEPQGEAESQGAAMHQNQSGEAVESANPEVIRPKAKAYVGHNSQEYIRQFNV